MFSVIDKLTRKVCFMVNYWWQSEVTSHYSSDLVSVLIVCHFDCLTWLTWNLNKAGESCDWKWAGPGTAQTASCEKCWISCFWSKLLSKLCSFGPRVAAQHRAELRPWHLVTRPY